MNDKITTLTPLELVDTEFDVYAIAPRDGDGRALKPDASTWNWELGEQQPDATEDAGKDVIGLEAIVDGDIDADAPADFARRVTSGVPGKANLHIWTTRADGSRLEEIRPYVVKTGQPDAINGSSGGPRPEQPA